MVESTLPPILTAHLFAELDDDLLELLESLTPDDWTRPTIVPRWNVRQIAAHLLDTALRRLAFGRDRAELQARPATSLTDLVNTMNAEGVAVYGRLSPRLLVAMMRPAARNLSDYLTSLDPLAPAAIGVSWAGEDRSANWFDIAREFTERWHHQQQIRLATDRPGIMTPRLYAPVLDCFMRALPYAYRDIAASVGDAARIHVPGECGGTWLLDRRTEGWSLVTSADPSRIVSNTSIAPEIAWRIFTKGISPENAREHATIEGDDRIGSGVLRMIAIVG